MRFKHFLRDDVRGFFKNMLPISTKEIKAGSVFKVPGRKTSSGFTLDEFFRIDDDSDPKNILYSIKHSEDAPWTRIQQEKMKFADLYDGDDDEGHEHLRDADRRNKPSGIQAFALARMLNDNRAIRVNSVREEMRPDIFDLPMLAKRHFGQGTKTTKNADGSYVVNPQNVSMSNMGGFMAEVKRLKLAASFDKATKTFTVKES